MLKVALLIPVYNEEKTIGKLIQSLNYPSRSIGISAPDTFCVGTGPLQHKDIIIVDDGSIDSTFKVVKDMGAIVLRHTSNLGKGQAHRTGFKYALQQGYDYVITLDGDGQHLPNEMCRFLDIIEKTRKDIIIGERHRSLSNMPFLRYCTNLITSFVVSFLSHKLIKDAQSGYRAISARVMKAVPLTTSHFDTESEILIRAARLGYSIGRVPISTIYLSHESKIRPGIDTLRFVKLALKSIWR